MKSAAEVHFNFIHDLLKEGKIVVKDGEIYKHQSNYDKLQKVPKSKNSFLITNEKGELVTIYREQINLALTYPPQNEQQGYTKLDLAAFWLMKNTSEIFKKTFTQSLEKKFYKNTNGTICLDQLKVLAWNIIFKENQPLSASFIKENYQGFYNYWQDNRKDLGESFSDFLINKIGVPEELAPYERDNYYIEMGKRWDTKVKVLLEQHCKHYVRKATFQTEEGEKRPDGLLEDINACIDIKLSFIPEKKLRKGKECNVYAKGFDRVIVLHLMGPRDKVVIDNVVSMNIYEWIKENQDRFNNVEEFIVKLEEAESNLELNGDADDINNILEGVLKEIRNGTVSNIDITRKTNFRYLSNVLSGSLYANYPLAKEVIEEHKRMKELVSWEKAYFVISPTGKELGLFNDHNKAIEAIQQHHPYFEIDPIQVHGIHKGLKDQKHHLHKGYFFVYETDFDEWEKNIEQHLNKAIQVMANNRFGNILLFKEVGKPYSKFHVTIKECANEFDMDPKKISKAIEAKTPYKGYEFSIFLLREYLEEELNANEELKQMIEFVEENRFKIMGAVMKKVEKDNRSLSAEDVNGIMEKTLSLLKEKRSISQISNELSYTGIRYIVKGKFFDYHKLSKEIQEVYQRNMLEQEQFFAVNILGETNGPFYTSNYQVCLSALQEKDKYFKFLQPIKDGIKKTVNGERPSYCGYCFVKTVNLDEWEKEQEKHLNEAKDRLEKSNSILVELEETLSGKRLKKVFDKIDDCRKKLGIGTPTLQKIINTDKIIEGKQYVKVTPRLFTSEDCDKYEKIGVNLPGLLEEILATEKEVG
ncbi:hypothetical protein PDN55_23475 [Bacillus cereus]|uniref:hypothetical protein n=1 Tax=Bacillus thuringiensis TaxID=1428 RepID=UPI000B409586|nr:hypothetical protein [Bacillus thuringiensis]ARX69635.1 hypothetical protein BVH75_27985 [Bacillus thuringiensis]MDA2423009.1 hypothetical protein [Bacillus cereus]MEB9694096.1 hypothetical protein [Bacillus cereus]